MTSRTIRRIVYVIVGLAGLMMVPRLLDEFRLSTHSTHPTGA